MYVSKDIGGMYIDKRLIKNNKFQPLIHDGSQQNHSQSRIDNNAYYELSSQSL